MAKKGKLQEDRLSDFTDGILCLILSFLPIKDAVKTSLLATRFRGLFLQLQRICIDQNVPKKMFPFITRRLKPSEGDPVAEFVLRCASLPESRILMNWLNKLVSGRLKIIQIAESSPEEGKAELTNLPHGLFLIKTLEVLKLRGKKFVVSIPEFVSCPKLKVLHINCAHVKNKSGPVSKSKALIFGEEGYPALEDIDLEVQPCGTFSLRISLTTLKRLTFRGVVAVKGARVEIDAPYLEHLDFMVSPSGEVKVGELQFQKSESLVSAVVGQFKQAKWCMHLLNRISNVKELQFVESHPQFYDYLPPNLLQFPKLAHLKLTNCDGGSARYFLQRAPCLKTFVYDGGCVSSFFGSGLCLAESLREVRLRGLYWDGNNVLEESEESNAFTARFFLKNAEDLERIVINVAQEWVTSTMELLKDANPLSTKCAIEIQEAKM